MHGEAAEDNYGGAASSDSPRDVAYTNLLVLRADILSLASQHQP